MSVGSWTPPAVCGAQCATTFLSFMDVCDGFLTNAYAKRDQLDPNESTLQDAAAFGNPASGAQLQQFQQTCSANLHDVTQIMTGSPDACLSALLGDPWGGLSTYDVDADGPDSLLPIAPAVCSLSATVAAQAAELCQTCNIRPVGGSPSGGRRQVQDPEPQGVVQNGSMVMAVPPDMAIEISSLIQHRCGVEHLSKNVDESNGSGHRVLRCNRHSRRSLASTSSGDDSVPAMHEALQEVIARQQALAAQKFEIQELKDRLVAAREQQ